MNHFTYSLVYLLVLSCSLYPTNNHLSFELETDKIILNAPLEYSKSMLGKII